MPEFESSFDPTAKSAESEPLALQDQPDSEVHIEHGREHQESTGPEKYPRPETDEL